jgi:alkanesulfonate monooxygenase SsuD/methylene tetrahydromethanopterin reductase-like flavin-dependent oxidoreductase (luciferase family)
LRPITFGFSIPPALDVHVQVKLAALVERLGFDRLWLPDHLAYPDWSQAPDVWTVLAAIAARTRRLTIGTAVSDPHRLPPAVFAQRAATLDALSRGRLIIGLGSGESMNLDPFAIAWDRRVTRLREALVVIRSLLDEKRSFDFQGRVHANRGGQLAMRPWKERHIPIFLAALGPKMQQICGEMGDGWLPVIIPPEHFAHYFEPIAEAARAAGRDPDRLERVANVPVALVDDPGAMREIVVKTAKRYALTLVWPPVLERMGMPLNPPAHLAEASYITVNPADPESMRRYKELQAWIPEEVVMKFVHYGKMPTLRRVVGDYIDAGATSVNLVNVSPDPFSSTVRLATELLPGFRCKPAPLVARAMHAALPLLGRLVRIPTVERSVNKP